MKKYLFSVLFAFFTCLTACADHEQIIAFEQLPVNAQEIIKTHFAAETVSYVILDNEVFGKDYEVRMASGTKVKFDKKGSLKKVDCGLAQVPAELIPEPVKLYVEKMFPNAFITEWGEDDRLWKAELNNGLDLKFNKKYEYVGVDD